MILTFISRHPIGWTFRHDAEMKEDIFHQECYVYLWLWARAQSLQIRHNSPYRPVVHSSRCDRSSFSLGTIRFSIPEILFQPELDRLETKPSARENRLDIVSSQRFSWTLQSSLEQHRPHRRGTSLLPRTDSLTGLKKNSTSFNKRGSTKRGKRAARRIHRTMRISN